MSNGETALSHAREIANAVLIPHAETVDITGQIPQCHLDALANHRLFGLWAPVALGGWSVTPQEARSVYEVLAGACGSTYFAWWQHHAIVRKLVASANTEFAAHWLPLLASGRARAGDVNYLRRPGSPMIRACRVRGGYEVDGTAPWVACWGLADVFSVAAVLPEATAVYLLVTADTKGMTAEPIADLLAMSGSKCAAVSFTKAFVPETNLITAIDLAAWRARDPRRNAQPMPAAFGVAGRALRLLHDQCRSRGDDDLLAAAERLSGELERCRETAYSLEDRHLSVGDVPLEAQVSARAHSHDLSVRISAALIVASGGRSTERTNPGQRLLREAAFHSIQTQTPLVKAKTVQRLAQTTSDMLFQDLGR